MPTKLIGSLTAILAGVAWSITPSHALPGRVSALALPEAALVQVHHKPDHTGGRGRHLGWYKKNRGQHKGWR
jgi:hypothetical protein